MSQYFCATTQRPVILKHLLASSGEGRVWITEDPKVLAKIYHHPTLGRQEKLRTMLHRTPRNPNPDQNWLSFAWPQSLVVNSVGMAVGFLMPRIEGSKELIDVYNPSRRKKVGLQVDWQFLHTTAHNICAIIESIHEAGYVLGDIKPQNILINNRAVPCVIDTDSFQVTNPQTGLTYRCLVGSEGFTPPELLGQDFAQIDQTEVHDRFRLGVIVYYLLFGSHPFQGRWIGTGETPEQTELIRQGHWAFGQQSLIRPSRLTIPITIVHPTLQRCLWRCFNDGAHNAQLRPTPGEWKAAFKEAIPQLMTCSTVKSHLYHRGEGKCYWCERKSQLKTDIFDHSFLGKAKAKAKTPPRPASVAISPPPSSVRLPRSLQKNFMRGAIVHRPAPLQSPSFFQEHSRLLLGGLSLVGSFSILGFIWQELPVLKQPETSAEESENLRGSGSVFPSPLPADCIEKGSLTKKDPLLEAAQKTAPSHSALPFCEEETPQAQTPVPVSPPLQTPTDGAFPQSSLSSDSSETTPTSPLAQKLILPQSAPSPQGSQLRDSLAQKDNVALNLALNFYDKGLYYKDLGLYYPAIKYLEESHFLLKKEGEKAMAAEVESVLIQVRQENANVGR
ncbi:MAG: protein kinase domain-containing protein [Cyanobacteriota bacterium]